MLGSFLLLSAVFIIILSPAFSLSEGKSIPAAKSFINVESERTPPEDWVNGTNSRYDLSNGHTLPLVSSDLQELLESIRTADNIEEVLSLTEEIPAMTLSMDRAMKIPSASLSDALLGIQALYRIASFITDGDRSLEQQETVLNELSRDRRVEQLAEMGVMQLSNLDSCELVTYLWSLAIIRLENIEFVKSVFDEYAGRINSTSSLKTEDIAKMTWTVGCVRDQYGWSDITLMQRLLEKLSIAASDIISLHPRLVVRMLWSLGVHNMIPSYTPFCCMGIRKVIDELAYISPTNKVSLLWCSSWASVTNSSIILPLLSELERHVLDGDLTTIEIVYTSKSLRMLSTAARRELVHHLERGRNQSNSTVAGLLSTLKSISSLLESIINRDFDFLDISSMAQLMRTVAKIEIVGNGNLGEQFLKKCKEKIIKGLLTENIRSFAAKDAASILEALSTSPEYPFLLPSEAQNLGLQEQSMVSMEEGNNKSADENMLNSSMQSFDREAILAEIVLQDRIWHTLAGRLAVIVSMNSEDLTNKAKLVAASWSVARLGHTYRPLFRVARVATKSILEDLNAQTLARLAVCIACEQAASLDSGGGMSVKLDREFIDLVTSLTLKKAKEITSLSDLAQALFSIAFIGRMASPLKRSADDKAWDLVDQSIDLSRLSLTYLTSPELIQLHWAIGRLPIRVFSDETVESIRYELKLRLPLMVMEDDTSPLLDPLAVKDSYLLVKTLVDSAAVKDSSLDGLKDQACSLLLQKCTKLFENNSSSEFSSSSPSSVDSSQVESSEETIVHASIVIDSLQAFIELQWFQESMLSTCQKALEKLESEMENSLISAEILRSLAFQYGILSQLLAVYQEIPVNKANKIKEKSKRVLPRLHGLLSRFFGNKDNIIRENTLLQRENLVLDEKQTN